VASAVLNASRELAGLLGITIIGAVLRVRQGDALAHGTRPAGAFLAGYHAGLALTIALVAAGSVLSFLALRRLPRSAATPTQDEVQDDAAAGASPAGLAEAEAEVVSAGGPEIAAGREAANRLA
jgi:hypothetical protein